MGTLSNVTTTPLHVTAAGKVYLAEMSEDELHQMIGAAYPRTLMPR